MQEQDTNLKNRSYSFALKIIDFTDGLDWKSPSLQVMAKQLMRSGTSIGANIKEAQSASSTKDFINFYYYALKSANETVFWLNLLLDSKKASEDKIKDLIREANELCNMTAAAIMTLKSKVQI